MSEKQAKPPAAVDSGHGHGDPDSEIQVRPLAQAILVLGAVVVFTGLVLWFVVGAMIRDESTQDVSSGYGPALELDRSRPAGPRLQPHPPEDLEALNRWEDSILNSYGWSDRAAGLARVPVEEALRRAADSGLARFPAAPEASQSSMDPSATEAAR